ncbi:cerebellar degeneration-related protein 2 isoform X2 [Sebastes umbrosus]|uniref:cerebellar degeneration-related protein 2 isoform X2 n=1 Tax=Sebastes umbrosus TaxID=72105 RepID=UPI00189FDF56|nr:cerebellar degeneration-related protein 2 isoform X2 [Sebastes umbrosus]
MLTDVILEEEFDKNGEAWYDPQDLEHDLHLAAALGKTLLDRNHELEQALQQMYSTNQEQLQEIEYMTKQVELLRQMNDQHARVYEQLDVASRDLEQGNQRLVQDGRLAQQRIHSLTETIDGLQTYVEDMQTQVDELKTAQAERNKRELAEQRRHLGAQSVSCLKELYDLHHDSPIYADWTPTGHPEPDQTSPVRHNPNEQHLVHDGLRSDGLWSPQGSFYGRDRRQDPEEENSALQRSVQTLQSQIAVERNRREAAERETESTSRENRGLEQQLDMLDGCRVRQKELEAEVEQLRLLWRADFAKSFRRPEQLLVPDTIFFASEERPSPGQDEMEEKVEKEEEQRRRIRQRCNSDGVLRLMNPDEIRRDHEQLCIRRAEAVKQRGISLLNEVDAQYSALQVKYDELLQQCQQADGPSHKVIQTPNSSIAINRTRRRRSSVLLSDLKVVLEDGQQPEYKALFKEIFTRIQQTKENLSDNRSPVKDSDAQDSPR